VIRVRGGGVRRFWTIARKKLAEQASTRWREQNLLLLVIPDVQEGGSCEPLRCRESKKKSSGEDQHNKGAQVTETGGAAPGLRESRDSWEVPSGSGRDWGC